MQPERQALAAPNEDSMTALRRTLQRLIDPQQYEQWFRGKTHLLIDSGELVVRAASPFLLTWIQKTFRTALAEAAHQALGGPAMVRYEVSPLAAPPPGGPRIVPAAASPESPTGDRTGDAESRPTGRRYADLADFVPGPGTELALAAVRQVGTAGATECNRLFLYGPAGMGKTHLLEGLCRLLRRSRPNSTALILSAEQFTNCFTQAHRERTLPAFRQRFRQVGALLIDDVDFLDGKRATQEELLHTVQQLEVAGGLVVACADRHPRLLTRISDELRTRFLAGLVCRLETPDQATRERIVLAKAQRLGLRAAPEALRAVAQRFTGSVRELEGALHCLHSWQRATGKPLGVTATRQVLSDLARDCLRVVRLPDIEQAVCRLFAVEPEDLRSPSRARSVSEPRMLAMYLARRHTRSAYSEIGRHFGGRNHATVIAAERKMDDLLRRGADLRVDSRRWKLTEIVDALEQQLLAG